MVSGTGGVQEGVLGQMGEAVAKLLLAKILSYHYKGLSQLVYFKSNL
jgi:hypothetical protein